MNMSFSPGTASLRLPINSPVYGVIGQGGGNCRRMLRENNRKARGLRKESRAGRGAVFAGRNLISSDGPKALGTPGGA